MPNESGVRAIKLDHVVYFTEKPPKMIIEEQKEMGWHAVIGGSHEKWGTHNALMYMNNAYIEWLSVENKEIAEKSGHQLVDLLLEDVQEGEGWGTMCLSVNQLDIFNEKLCAEGYQTSGVIPAERKTVNGQIRKWKMLFVNQAPSENLPFPFFIEWEKDESERYKELRIDGTVLPDNEKLAITECVLSVRDPVVTISEWSKLLSITPSGDTLRLPNAKLKFVGIESDARKERLVEVVVEHI